MDTQHCQEAFLRQSPISFRYIILSAAVSVIINGAAFCALLSIRTPVLFSKYNNALIVNITDIQDKNKKIEQNRNFAQQTTVKKNTKQHTKPTKKIVKAETTSDIIKEKTVYMQKAQHSNTNLQTQQKQRCSTKHEVKTDSFENKKGVAKANLSIVSISKDNCPYILSWIAKHKFYPLRAIYRHEEDRVALNFIINSSGEITAINIEKPSKYTKLNLAAVKILEKSSPIPSHFLNCVRKLPIKAQTTIAFKLE